MLAHEHVWAAIDRLAERNGLSPSGLARRAGLDPTTFNKSKRLAGDGRPRWPSTESISKILAATNTDVSDFFALFPPNRANGTTYIPLMGSAHAGFEDMSTSDQPVAPAPNRVVQFPDPKAGPLYALSVVGDSMGPVYRDGDLLFISYTDEVTPGDRVVVKLKTQQLAVKQLKAHDDGTLYFHAINPDHADVVYAHDDVEWMGKIVYATQ